MLPWWVFLLSCSFSWLLQEKLIYFSSFISALNYLSFLAEDATRDRYGRGGKGQPARMLGDRDEEQTAGKHVQSSGGRKKLSRWEE